MESMPVSLWIKQSRWELWAGKGQNDNSKQWWKDGEKAWEKDAVQQRRVWGRQEQSAVQTQPGFSCQKKRWEGGYGLQSEHDLIISCCCAEHRCSSVGEEPIQWEITLPYQTEWCTVSRGVELVEPSCQAGVENIPGAEADWIGV